MGVPMVSRCCCCCSLQTGTVIIGFVYTVWAFLELTFYSLVVTLLPMGDEAHSQHKYVLYVTAAGVSGAHLLCSLLLVAAAYKKLPPLTLPWTIVTGIITAIYFVMCLMGMSLVLQDSGEILAVEVTVICIYLARVCISVYCIVVVHSRHKQLMNEEDENYLQQSGKVYKPVLTEEINL